MPAFRPSNDISAIAISSDGIESDTFKLPVGCIGLAPELTFPSDNTDPPWFVPTKVGYKFRGPTISATKGIPFVGGKVGIEVSFFGAFDYDIRGGSWELALGTGEAKTRIGRRPKTTQVKPDLKLFVGDQEINVEAKGFVKGQSAQERWYLPTEGGIGIGVGGKVLLKKMPLVALPGVSQALEIARLKALAKNISIDIWGTYGLQGQLSIDPRIKAGDVRVLAGLEGSYEPKVSNIELKVYIGGDLTYIWDFERGRFPETQSGFDFKMYGGFETNIFWLKNVEFVWFEEDPSPLFGANPFSMISTPSLDASEWQAVERVWRDRDYEVFNPQMVPGPPTESPTEEAPPETATAQSTETLVTNGFPEASPSLSAYGNEQMLLYVRDTGADNPAHFTEVAFTRFDGTNWSAPAAVASDVRGQFTPRVAHDGAGRAVAVWEQIKDPAFNEPSVEGTAARIELIGSVWNPTLQTWGTPLPLTDNAIIDHQAKLEGPLADGDLILTWIQNDANLITGTGEPGASTNDRVRTMRWDSSTGSWATPNTLVSNLSHPISDSLAALGDHAIYVWSKDVDGNWETEADSEIYYRLYDAETDTWQAETRYTNDTNSDRNAVVQMDNAGNSYIIWLRGSEVVVDRNLGGTPTVVRTGADTLGFSDLTATVSPNGHLLVLWQERNEAGGHAQYRILDPVANVWSADRTLLEEPGLERSFSCAWDASGHLNMAYNRVSLTTVTKSVIRPDGSVLEIPNVPQPERVDLLVTRKSIVKDLAFSEVGLSASGTTYLAGDAVTVLAKVHNKGDLAAQDTQVAFYDGSPAGGGVLLQTLTIPGAIESNGTRDVSFVWTLPSPSVAHTIYAVVDPSDQVVEADETNNSSSREIGGVDLQADFISGSVSRDGSVRCVARVTNMGAPSSPVTKINLWSAENPGVAPLAWASVVALKSTEFADVVFQLPVGSQGEGAKSYRLVSDQESVAPDIDRENNEWFFSLSLHIDDDQDGIPRAWELANGLSDTESEDAYSDTDGDGFGNLQEYVAGTNPRDAQSFLKVEPSSVVVNPDGSKGYAVKWIPVDGRVYSVARSFDLQTWEIIVDGILPTPPLNSVTDTPSVAHERVFYRLHAR